MTEQERQEAQADLTQFKGVLADLPRAQQEAVRLLADNLKGQVKANGELGLMAVALLGLELQLEE